MSLLRAFAISLACAVITVAPHTALASNLATPENAHPYRDLRLQQWSKDFLAGKLAVVESAVSADLASSNPHPYAAYIWITVEHSLGWSYDEAVQRAPAAARTQVANEAAVDTLELAGRERDLLARFPASAPPVGLSPWAMIELEAAATDLSRYDDAFAYKVAQWRAAPNSFAATYAFFYQFNGMELAAERALAVQLAKAQPTAPGADLLKRIAEDRGLASLDVANLAEKSWGELDDWWSYRFRATVECNFYRYDNCLALYQKAEQVFPFRPILRGSDNTAVYIASVLIQQRRIKEARAFLESREPLYGPPSQVMSLVLRDLAKAFSNDGQNAAERNTLAQALQASPDDPLLIQSQAFLEQVSANPSGAVALWRRVTALNPMSNEAWSRLVMDYVAAKDLDGGARAWIQALAAMGEPTADMAHAHLQLLQAQGNDRAAVTEAQADLAKWPQSVDIATDLSASLGKLRGQDADAIGALDRALDVTVNRASIDAYLKLADRAGTSSGDAALAKLQARFPTNSEIADAEEARILARTGNDRAAVSAADDADIDRAPTMGWPYYYRAYEAVMAHDLSKADAVINKGLAAVPGDAPARLAELYGDRAVIGLDYDGAGAGDPAHLAAIEADIAAARAHGASQTWLFKQQYRLAQRRGQTDAATALLISYEAISPDDWVVDEMMGSESKVGERKFMALHHYLEQNPYDALRLKVATQRHALFGGSPVLALAYAKTLKDLYPTDSPGNVAFWERTAIDSLGDFKNFYHAQYDNVSFVSASDLYVGWFDNARKRAQSGGSATLLPERLDLQKMSATVLTPSGIEIERRYDSDLGRLTYLRIGESSLSLAYSEDGLNLTRLTDSAGDDIALDYDAAGKIIEMRSKGGATIDFAYAANGKPEMIKVAGIGAIHVTYNPDNSIDHVSSDGGRDIALKVTSAFQDLLSLVNAASSSSTEIPELPFKDPTLDKLLEVESRAEAGDRSIKSPMREAILNVARYMIDHIADRRAYGSEAQLRLDRLFDAATADGATSADRAAGLEAAGLWRDLATRLYREGLDEDHWSTWQKITKWIDQEAVRDPANAARIQKVEASINAQPLHLLKSSYWLPRSYVDNDGSWRRYPLANVFPQPEAAAVQVNAMLVRKNGDVLLGTVNGLSILHGGFWRQVSFDPSTHRFTRDVEPDGASRPGVLSLTEDGRGRLWIGLAGGLVRIDDTYEGDATAYESKLQGLPSLRVQQLAPYGNDCVLVGTDGGLRLFSTAGATTLPQAFESLASSPINLLRKGAGEHQIIVGTDKSLFAAGAGPPKALAAYVVDDAAWLNGVVYVLHGGHVESSALSANGQPGALRPITDAQDIFTTGKIEGLTLMPLDDGSPALAVMTDQGLSIFNDGHFEYKKLPLAERGVDVRIAATSGGATYFASSDGIFALNPAKTITDTGAPVLDLLTLPDEQLTFVARGERLDVVHGTGADQTVQSFSNISSSFLARDRDGGLITNDGTTIVRFAPGSTTPTLLFEAAGHELGGDIGAPVHSLLVDSHGVIWVTAGASLFRYEDGKAEEFSTYLDNAKFPAESDRISRVIETVDGRILVVASNDSYLSLRNQPLSGGLLQWVAGKFVRLPGYQDMPWFMTGYTPIGGDRAIIGTNNGFAMQDGTAYYMVDPASDPSYRAVSEKQPMLFLGTRGAQFDSKTWFFGTAGGVVVWHDGRWILPTRLNWLLPDNHLSHYGSRTVHAIATDAAGHIFVGTDRGLLVYNSGGTDFMQFIEGEAPDLAFAELESNKLAAESNQILSAISSAGPLGARIQQVRSAAAELQQARAQSRAAPLPTLGATSGANAAGELRSAPKPPPEASAKLAELESSYRHLLAGLEKDNRSLYQMLELKPLDLEGLRRQISPDDLVVQYLPAHEKLLIHLVSKDQLKVVEVAVNTDALQDRAQTVSNVIAFNARRNRGLLPLGSTPQVVAENVLYSSGSKGEMDELHWLYDQLLLPVEADLSRYKHIYIVPVGALTHLPFAALVRTTGPTPEYAAQRYQLGVLPSMYLLDLVLHAGDRDGNRTVIFGNPTQNLPGAEAEAREIHSIVGVGNATMKTGSDASIDALRKTSSSAHWLHFATHGHLDSNDPSKSYLLMAGNQQFSIIDVLQLDLTHAEMVVLSACESGVGATGLEYATLARAFAQAGAPSIVASLWQVPDAPTAALMEAFYKRRTNGDDVFQALAGAQRDMIAAGGPGADPSAWSGFVPFGRP